MENSNPTPSNKQPGLRSITRLVVGSLLMGAEGLASRLALWETELDRRQAEDTLAGPVIVDMPSAGATVAASEGGFVERTVERHSGRPAPEEPDRRSLHVAVGLAFGIEEAVERSLHLVHRASRTAGNLVDLLGGPIYHSRALTPLRDRIDLLAERGQEQVDQWIETGRSEEQRSRDLAQMTISGQVNEAIDYLTADQGVQELVQSQSVGLVGEMLEETRERSLSADNFLEEIVRSMFRRRPRSELPVPSPEVRSQAVVFRQHHGRIIRK